MTVRAEVPRRSRRWATAVAVVVLVVTAVLLPGCSRDDRRLRALKSDPLAGVELPGARSVRVTESAGSTPPGETAPAKVRRTFTVESGTVEEAIDHLAEQARANGWSLQPRPVIGFSGEKTIDGYFSQAVIAGLEPDGTVWVEIYTHDN